jgi:hypothetical protein
MNTRTCSFFPAWSGVVWIVGCCLFAGCKSTPSIDWNSRIGNYTFDQAVTELGPPDKIAKLNDGTTVADWIKSGNTGFSFGMGTGYAGPNGAVGVGQTTNTGYNAKVLRLVFGRDNLLISWSKNY